MAVVVVAGVSAVVSACVAVFFAAYVVGGAYVIWKREDAKALRDRLKGGFATLGAMAWINKGGNV